MATACYINHYLSYSDRGAFVQREPSRRVLIDEADIKVGEPLPQWNDIHPPIVTAYDGQRLDLEYNGKAFSIKVGEEQLIDEGILSQQYGVTEYSQTTVKVISTQLVYKGEWQQGSTVSQKLEGPVGNGEVWYPNGDYFKGYFHLSYGSISGPAYAADGRYTFADGSYIEHAWIHTSKDRTPDGWGLHGVFRIHHPKGSDSIALFCRGGKRYGMELFLDEKTPRVKEWYADEEMIRWERDEPKKIKISVADYQLDETSRVDCLRMELTVNDQGREYRIVQEGGDYETNQYDNNIYKPSTRVTLFLPNGDSIDHYGFGTRMFESYDGYVTYHNAKAGKCRQEVWANGKMVKAEEWRYDKRAAEKKQLPHPFGQGKTEALVWKDGHIEYTAEQWVYDGEMAYGFPQGKGVLTGGKYNHEGERYEGEFQAGIFQKSDAATAPIMLHVRYGHQWWTAYDRGDWKWVESDIEAAIGWLDFIGFCDVKIARINQKGITLTSGTETRVLTPGETIRFYAEIEGREWSDGCVYDGDDYQLLLTWK